jgi:transposase
VSATTRLGRSVHHEGYEIGLDLAKNVFQVHGVNARGKTVLRKQLRLDQVAPFFANLPPCLVGVGACSSAHHWARKLEALGHTVRLMAPQFVSPKHHLRCSTCVTAAYSDPAPRRSLDPSL